MKDEIKETNLSEMLFNRDERLLDCITNLQILYDKATTDLVKEGHARIKLQEENEYLKDIVSNTELSNEIKKADKWSKKELYKINYQRLKANQRLQEENEKLKEKIGRLEDRLINRRTRIDKAIEYMNNYNELVIQTADIKSLVLKEEYKKIINILQGSDDNE